MREPCVTLDLGFRSLCASLILLIQFVVSTNMDGPPLPNTGSMLTRKAMMNGAGWISLFERIMKMHVDKNPASVVGVQGEQGITKCGHETSS